MKPINKQNLRKTTLTILGALFAVAGAGAFIYFCIDIISSSRKVYELHTSRQITDLEIATVILEIALMAASAICFRLIKDKSTLWVKGHSPQSTKQWYNTTHAR